MPFNVDDDEYVAKLLAQDAKKTSKTYDMVGLDAFNPKRSRAAAPKPNTNFLRNIIRQTDSHNAALLAREAEESNLRLRQMNRERDKGRTEAVDRAKRRIEGRLSPPPKADDSQKPHSSRRRDDHGDDEAKDHSRERRKGYRDERSESRSRRHRDRSRERDRHKRRHSDSDDERAHKSRRLRDHRNDDRRHRDDSERENRRSRRQCRKSRQSYPRSPSRSRSRSPRRKAHRKCSRSRSPKTSLRSSKKSREDRRRTHTPASDSDPLEAIVGPLPPPPEPTVRSRGRGALKANNLGIESRFSTNYNPSIDMKPGSDAEDDWGEALEVMRDRERWKQQGADRLRAAGFKDEQVKKWEKGGDPLEEDVVWSKRGQDREWDRGKVVDEDGDIDLKADWGRLK